MAARLPVREEPDERLDLGAFGRLVAALLVGLLVLALAVVVLVDVGVWPLALFTVGMLVLWTRWVR